MKSSFSIATAAFLLPLLAFPGLVEGQAVETNMVSNLEARVGCSGGSPIATLTWTPDPNAGGAQQRVDVATFIGGFVKGVFETTGPLPPEKSSVQWEQVAPGVLHFWRVLTFQGDDWIPSKTANFKHFPSKRCMPP